MPNDQPDQNNPVTGIPPVDPQPVTPPVPPVTEVPPMPEQSMEMPATNNGSAAPQTDIPPMVTNGGPTTKKKFGGGKFIPTILGLLILTGAVSAGAYLVKQNQDIREKAAGETCDADHIGNKSYEQCFVGVCQGLRTLTCGMSGPGVYVWTDGECDISPACDPYPETEEDECQNNNDCPTGYICLTERNPNECFLVEGTTCVCDYCTFTGSTGPATCTQTNGSKYTQDDRPGCAREADMCVITTPTATPGMGGPTSSISSFNSCPNGGKLVVDLVMTGMANANLTLKLAKPNASGSCDGVVSNPLSTVTVANTLEQGHFFQKLTLSSPVTTTANEKVCVYMTEGSSPAKGWLPTNNRVNTSCGEVGFNAVDVSSQLSIINARGNPIASTQCWNDSTEGLTNDYDFNDWFLVFSCEKEVIAPLCQSVKAYRFYEEEEIDALGLEIEYEGDLIEISEGSLIPIPLTELSSLTHGSKFALSILGQGAFTKARFMVTTATTPAGKIPTYTTDAATKIPGTQEFYAIFTIPDGANSLTIQGQVGTADGTWY